MDDDNRFDEDDALDYILYEECEKDVQQDMNNSGGGKGGCLGVAFFLLTPPPCNRPAGMEVDMIKHYGDHLWTRQL